MTKPTNGSLMWHNIFSYIVTIVLIREHLKTVLNLQNLRNCVGRRKIFWNCVVGFTSPIPHHTTPLQCNGFLATKSTTIYVRADPPFVQIEFSPPQGDSASCRSLHVTLKCHCVSQMSSCFILMQYLGSFFFAVQFS